MIRSASPASIGAASTLPGSAGSRGASAREADRGALVGVHLRHMVGGVDERHGAVVPAEHPLQVLAQGQCGEAAAELQRKKPSCGCGCCVPQGRSGSPVRRGPGADAGTRPGRSLAPTGPRPGPDRTSARFPPATCSRCGRPLPPGAGRCRSGSGCRRRRRAFDGAQPQQQPCQYGSQFVLLGGLQAGPCGRGRGAGTAGHAPRSPTEHGRSRHGPGRGPADHRNIHTRRSPPGGHGKRAAGRVGKGRIGRKEAGGPGRRIRPSGPPWRGR